MVRQRYASGRLLLSISFATLVFVNTANAQSPHLKVEQGQSTFDFEGSEGGRYHSRTPHVPSQESGLTIGRGYDLKERSVDVVIRDLMEAGLSHGDAMLYARAAGLQGAKAKKYIDENQLPEITLEQQKSLFELIYPQYVEEAKRQFPARQTHTIVREFRGFWRGSRGPSRRRGDAWRCCTCHLAA
ncbi:hypothetical protein Pla8534_64290 [Lignipirellula cremea]|uniref:Uncharacterized protein n=1 Tax=Lignipirellula cremea TaxID=2528010 RepID=A0A518E393_9BACT|nr:hypothetical protein Pla8534_64290 [Lignipirellula cremea]